MKKVYKERGRPPKREVKDRLLKLFEECRVGTTYRLKELYGDRFEEVSWNTVKKYIEKLREEGKVKRQAEISHSNGDRRVVYLFTG